MPTPQQHAFGRPGNRDERRADGPAWCQASIAAGTPATEALAAAERTVAAYTGAEPPPES